MIHGVAGSSWCITLQGDLWLRISDSSHVLPNGKVVLRMCLAFPYCVCTYLLPRAQINANKLVRVGSD